MIWLQQKRIPRVLFCIVLSVLLHLLLGGILLLLPQPPQVKREKAGRKAKPVRVVRTAARKKADEVKKTPPPETTEKAPTEHKPFVKTSADTPQARPLQPEYEGKRSTRAASAADSSHRVSPANAPAMDGVEKEELVTFDQDRQQGDLKYEGLDKQQAAEAPSPVPPAPPEPPAEASADGLAQGVPEPDNPGKDAESQQVDAANSLTLNPDLSGLLKVQQPDIAPRLPELEQHAARLGSPGATGNAPTRGRQSRVSRVCYDPSLAHQQQKPGFRTNERRSRSSGRFVLGKGAALNVAASPRGQYEAMVYRQVAHFWYIACDEHRGDIIPGKITISLRITRRGQIDSMALIRRSGASVSQQSFTFKAIRKANLPPMPPEVQADVIGNLMELIFEFNFD